MSKSRRKADVRRTCCGVRPEIREAGPYLVKFGLSKGWVNKYVIYCPKCGRRTGPAISLKMAQLDWEERNVEKETQKDNQVSLFDSITA